jgi:hypothetical protein
MPDERSTAFTFTYEARLCCKGNCNAEASLSDGMNEVYLSASHILCDPMRELLAAVVRLFYYAGESRCQWFDEPGADCWLFQRDGDLLHITIPDAWFSTSVHWYERKTFSVTCDFWNFVRKLRLYASRLIADERIRKDYRDHLNRSSEYMSLCEFIEEHKRQKKQTKSVNKS